MLKKTRLSEKLKKLKVEGAGEKAELQEAAERVEGKSPEKTESLLKVKKPEEIEEKKPEKVIEPLIEEERRGLRDMSDLAIPGQKLSKMFRIETSYTEETLTQMFTAWKDPEKVIKWTVKLDRHGKEFYSLKGEGLLKMKDSPPVYGMELEDGAIIATHIGGYTFIMGCYNFDVRTLVKIFAYGIENAKRFIGG